MMIDEIRTTSDILAALPVPIEPNQPAALIPRQAPLTGDDFGKIEGVIATRFRIDVPLIPQRVPLSDDLGHVYRWETQYVDGTPVLIQTGDVDPRLFDAVKRPATPGHVAAHLTRLAAHLRHTKGNGAWQIVIEDVARDLIGVSEWAVVKACADFRSGDKPFFPDTPELLAKIRKWDDFARRMGADPAAEPAKPRTPRKEPVAKPTPEQRKKVSALMHAAGIHRGKMKENAEYCEDCRREIENSGEAT